MEYFVFDTEASGMGEKAELIQFAGIRLTEDLKIKGLVNWFCNINTIVEPEAFAVHKLDNAKIAKLSGGNYFEDYLMLPEADWLRNPKDITFIAYNTRFDKRIINQTLKLNGYGEVNFGRKETLVPNKLSNGVYNFCLMEACNSVFNHNLYNKSLKEMVANQTRYPDREIMSMLDKLCKQFKVNNFDTGFHGALFDALATTLLLHSNRRYFFK